jgi:hypothetical protein
MKVASRYSIALISTLIWLLTSMAFAQNAPQAFPASVQRLPRQPLPDGKSPPQSFSPSVIAPQPAPTPYPPVPPRIVYRYRPATRCIVQQPPPAPPRGKRPGPRKLRGPKLTRGPKQAWDIPPAPRRRSQPPLFMEILEPVRRCLFIPIEVLQAVFI